MDKLRIRGGRRLAGEIAISGAKNAALPELCAALLTAEPVLLSNVPRLHDVATMLKLLRTAGRRRRGLGRRGGHRVARRRPRHEPRGALRPGEDDARVDPGARPAASRASARRAFRCRAAARSARGRSTSTSRACRRSAPKSRSSTATSSPAPGSCKGARITTDMVTVTGTENLLMAATLAEGETVLENAAQEPEIPDLAEMLIAMGARIEGHGTEPHPHRGRARAAWRGASHHSRPHRGRHLPLRRGGGGRRRGAAPRPRRPPRGGDRQAARGRRDDRGRRRLDPRPRRGPAARGELSHQRVPGASRPTCRRSSWRSTASPRARRPSPRRSSRTASCTCRTDAQARCAHRGRRPRGRDPGRREALRRRP